MFPMCNTKKMKNEKINSILKNEQKIDDVCYLANQAENKHCIKQDPKQNLIWFAANQTNNDNKSFRFHYMCVMINWLNPKRIRKQTRNTKWNTKKKFQFSLNNQIYQQQLKTNIIYPSIHLVKVWKKSFIIIIINWFY